MRRAVTIVVALGALWTLSACAPKAASKATVAGEWGALGGLTIKRADTEIEGTRDKDIYLNERYSLKGYRIALANGSYVVKLHVAETYEGIKAVGDRVYTVSLEGKPVLKDFDPYKEAGKRRFAAIVRQFTVDVADGELTLEFAEKTQNPMINGIEVLEKGGCPLWPRTRAVLLINCGAQADYKDKAGRLWKKDQEIKAQ